MTIEKYIKYFVNNPDGYVFIISKDENLTTLYCKILKMSYTGLWIPVINFNIDRSKIICPYSGITLGSASEIDYDKFIELCKNGKHNILG